LSRRSWSGGVRGWLSGAVAGFLAFSRRILVAAIGAGVIWVM
jgi:hypothetical protein